MNISDLLTSLANGKGLNITPGVPDTDLQQVVSRFAQGNGVPQMPFGMAVPQLPDASSKMFAGVNPPSDVPTNLPGSLAPSNDAQTGGYMGVGAGLQGNIPKSPLPPPETELTAPKGGLGITTGSIAQPARATEASGAPDFSPSFADGLINVGNALQGKSASDLGEDTLSKNMTYKALLQKGIDSTTAEALVRNPDLMKHALPTVFGGGKYGKQGTVFQDANGNFYTAQFAEDGTRRIMPLTIDGAPTPGGNGSPGIPLSPSRGVEFKGDTAFDKATAQPIRNISANLEGGKFAEKTGELNAEGANALPKQNIALQQYQAQDKAISDNIEKAITQATGWTTGFIGDWAKGIAGTPAHDLKNTLDSVRSNLGFDKLQAMRDASPTGGALGQVSENENVLLQSVWGSAQQSQTKEQLIANLNKIKAIREQYSVLKQQAYNTDVQRFGVDKVPDLSTGKLPQKDTQKARPANSDQSGGARPRAVNPQTGQTLEFDGQNWIEVH